MAAIIGFGAGYLVPLGVLIWAIARTVLTKPRARYAYLVAIVGMVLLLLLLLGFAGGGGLVGLFGLAATIIGLGLGGWWDRADARVVSWGFVLLVGMVALGGIVA
ncbi:hypothetical protein NR756_06600 [Alloalcanivorax xenomutans]|uniref:hypothetical protein n=1 Tax=Alloalcanivorax xenomutans TaxID=1094342 RepID=UPI003A810493